MTRIYEGIRTGDDVPVITVDGKPLNMRQDIRNHSPLGGNWGYAGSGPAQLALALIADATGDDEVAQYVYQKYKGDIVAQLDRESWIITSAEIRSWIASVLSTTD